MTVTNIILVSALVLSWVYFAHMVDYMKSAQMKVLIEYLKERENKVKKKD